MVLFGTGVYFNEGKQSANLGFTGLDINDKDDDFSEWKYFVFFRQ